MVVPSRVRVESGLDIQQVKKGTTTHRVYRKGRQKGKAERSGHGVQLPLDREAIWAILQQGAQTFAVEVGLKVAGCLLADEVERLCGLRPTIGIAGSATVEAHLLDYPGLSLYEQTIELRFLEFIRPEKQFDGLEALVNQIRADVDRIRERHGTVGKDGSPFR